MDKNPVSRSLRSKNNYCTINNPYYSQQRITYLPCDVHVILQKHKHLSCEGIMRENFPRRVEHSQALTAMSLARRLQEEWKNTPKQDHVEQPPSEMDEQIYEEKSPKFKAEEEIQYDDQMYLKHQEEIFKNEQLQKDLEDLLHH